MKERTRWYRFSIAVVCLLGLALLFAGGVAHAKKPVKPPPDPDPVVEGWLYFVDSDMGNTLWRMDADGSGEVEQVVSLPDSPALGGYTDYCISNAAYGNNDYAADYWVFYFKQIEDNYYLDGTPRIEIFAARVDGTDEIQLTDDADFQFAPQQRVAISPDDSQLAFNGIHSFTTDSGGFDMPDEAGIHAIELTWTVGKPLAGTGRTMLSTIEWWLSYQDWTDENGDARTYHFAAPLRDLDWSGDGSQLVAGRVSVEGDDVDLRVITPDWENATATDPGDFTEVALTYLVSGEPQPFYGAFPRWSPTTDQILFAEDPTGYLGISVITPEGETDYEVLVAPVVGRKVTTSTGLYSAWSPDGGQFAYLAASVTRNSSSSTVSIYDMDTGAIHDTEAAPPGYALVGWRPALP